MKYNLGSARTVLRFDGENDVIRGRNTSHVRFRDLAFGRQRLTTSQGVVVSSTATTLTLDIQGGYPMPPEIMGDPKRLAPGAGRWLRRYRQGAGGECEIMTDATEGRAWPPKANIQVKWLNASRAAPEAHPARWTLGGLNWTFGKGSEPHYKRGDIVGIKSKHGGQAFFFDGGDAISFQNVRWTEHSRGVRYISTS